MTLRPFAVLAAAALLLSGCGGLSGENANITLAWQLLPQVLGDSGGVDPASAGGAQPPLTRAAIAASPVPLMLASVVGSGTATLLQESGRNRNEVTFTGADGTSVTFEDGILVATRGLGPDLMGAEVGGVRRALRAGGGEARRVHDYLDGFDQIVRRAYACRIEAVGAESVEILERRFDTRRFEERCAAGAVTFTNTYWVDRGGVIRKSRQLVSPPLGYLDSERL